MDTSKNERRWDRAITTFWALKLNFPLYDNFRIKKLTFQKLLKIIKHLEKKETRSFCQMNQIFQVHSDKEVNSSNDKEEGTAKPTEQLTSLQSLHMIIKFKDPF